MAKITYTDKETLNEIPSIPAKNKVQAADMNEIKNVVNQNELKILLIADSSAPAECSTGDMYYNTTTKLIYTATGTNTWGSTGVNPTQNTLYIDSTNKSTYFYDGSDLISVGGGAGGETLPVGSEIDFDGQASDIPSGWEQVSGKSYVAYELWANPNPTSNFASQNITLNSDDYDMLEIYYLMFGNNNYMQSIKIPKGYSTRLMTYTSQLAFSYRNISYVNNTTYLVDNESSSNDRCVPYKVIGYKEV